MTRILIVRLGSLGDIIHAIPAAAALRETFPQSCLDWAVDERNRDILDLVPFITGRVILRTQSRGSWRDLPRVIRDLRRASYDVALDLQGLLKSAILARASGARRVVGFAATELRERGARPFYTEAYSSGATHVIEKNLALVRRMGAETPITPFPLELPESTVTDQVRSLLGAGVTKDGFALLNPGAAWPNKRWPAERFGELARHLSTRHGLRSAVTWGPGESGLAQRVVEASAGAAVVAPETTVGDLAVLVREAALMVSGDTGPVHLAAAVATPIVGIYGPTDPRRNGPWAAADLSVSRFETCECHHRRRCHSASWCLERITVEEVATMVDRRLEAAGSHSSP